MTPSPEILAMLDRIKFQRYMTSADLPDQKIGADGKKLCKWCDAPLPGRRRSWCSDACSDEFVFRFHGATAASKVYDRDQGVCIECGMDTKWLLSQYLKIYHKTPKIVWNSPERAEFKKQWGPWYPGNGEWTFWQADHIIPVIEGGGCCGLDNLQTLCTRCHKADTKELAARLAKARRDEKRGSSQDELCLDS